MFGIFYKGWNLLVRGFRKFQEIVYATINIFGLRIDPSHFTSQNLQNYREWIQRFFDQVSDIPKNPSTKDIFHLEEVQDGILEPKYLAKRQDLKYLSAKNKELLFLEVIDIEKIISQYLEKSHKNSGFFAQYLGASSDKMTPDKMILLFISKYISEEMIDYDDRSEDLERLKKLLNYIKELLCINTIKYDIQLRETLVRIKIQLDSAHRKMQTRTEHNQSRILISSIANVVNNLIVKLSRYLFKLFNFKSFKIESEIKTEAEVAINRWLGAVSEVRVKQVQISDKISVTGFVTKFQLIHHECKSTSLGEPKSLLQFCPALNYEHISDHLLRLQYVILYLLPLDKILSYLNINVSDVLNNKKIFTIYDIKQILLSVKLVIKSLKSQIDVIKKWDDMYYAYRASENCTEAEADKLIELAEIITSIENDIKTLNDNILLLQEQIEKSIVPVDLVPEPNTQTLLALIDCDSGLVGKDEVVIQCTIKNFLHDLRVNNIFDTKLYEILDKYFIIVSNFESSLELTNQCQEIMAIKPGVIKSDDFSLEYYYLMLIIFIETVRKLPRDNIESTRVILNKIKDFMIINFIINNYKYIALLFDVITEQTLRIDCLEDQNIKLKRAIATHLENFKISVLEMIEANRDFFNTSSAIEHLVTDAIDCKSEYQIISLIEDKKIFTTQQLVTRLEVFIHNLILKIDRLNRYLKHLRADRGCIIVDSDKLITMRQTLNKYIILKDTVIETNKVLISAIKSITSLTVSYLSLEKCYRTIISGDDEECRDIEPDDGTQISAMKFLLDKLDCSKLILQNDTKSIEARIHGINISLSKNFSYVIDSIKKPIGIYLTVLYDYSSLQFSIRHFFAWAGGHNTILEYLIMKYLYDLLCDIEITRDSEKQPDERIEKVFACIKSLKHLSKDHTAVFSMLIEDVYGTIVSIYPVGQIKSMNLHSIRSAVPGFLITTPHHVGEHYSNNFKKLMYKL